MPHHCWFEVNQASMVSLLPVLSEEPHYCPEGMSLSSTTWSFLISHHWPCYSQTRVEVDAPHLALMTGCNWDPQFFLWCLAGIRWLFPGLLGCSLVLWLEKAGFFLELFCMCPLGFLGFQLLQHLVLYIWGKKLTQGNHCYVVPQVLRSVAGLLSLQLAESSFLCFIYSVRVLVVLSRKNR